MILETQTDVAIMELGDTNDSIDMQLDLDSAQILMQMLSKNLYSDAVGSTVRETCSNALDSHRKAKTDDPIIVSFKSNNDNTYSFMVEDFGTGLDADDVANIISKYGKSTKRLEANSLGMMGLGFKSPLAYSSSFHFICRKNGMEWKYMMYEGEDSNKIDLLYSQKTTEKNGVKIIIPVKYQDKQEFLNKIREQLAYFESVYFDTSNVVNDFTIIRAEHYQTSPLVSINVMHLCLDNVYYPIDFDKLGISPIYVPVGLRFGLSDGIFPTPNRESIRYTVEAKKIILEKIGKVATAIVTMYNESLVATDDIENIFKYYGSSDRNILIGAKRYDVNPLLKYTDLKLIKPTLTGVELLDLSRLTNRKDSLVAEYQIRYKIKGHKMSEVKSKDTKTLELNKINDTYYYVYDAAIAGKKREYLKDQFDYSTYYLCRKVGHYDLGFKTRPSNVGQILKFSYYNVLKLENYPKHQWRQVIKEFQFIQEVYFKKFHDIDTIDIPQSWSDARKRQRVYNSSMGNGRRIKLTGDVFGKTAVPLERYVTGQSCKFIAGTFQLDLFHKFKGLTVYDSYDNQDKLDALYYISSGTNEKMRFLSFSNREMKVLSTVKIHNLISYNDFMKGDNKPFKRLITAYLISKLIDDYKNIFGKKFQLSTISTPLLAKITLLQKYKEDHFRYADSDIYKDMLVVAEEYMLFDMSVYMDYLEISDLFKKLTFLEPIMAKMTFYGIDPLIPVLVDLFKYYKYKIDTHNYKLPSIEMLDLDVLFLTDDVIEELTTI
jgi:hypothetical protein